MKNQELANILETYFQKNKLKIQHILQVFNKTKYGQEHPNEKDIYTYFRFCKISFLPPKILQETPKKLIINGKKLLSFKTAGTASGTPKTIYCLKEVSGEYVPDIVTDAVNQKTPIVAVHTKRKKREYVYWVYEKIYKNFCPSLLILKYFNQNTAIETLKYGKVIIIFEYPSALHRLLHYIEEYLKKNPKRKILFQKENIIIELMGEPINIKELDIIEKRCIKVFGCQPIIWVSYGLTECGSVGIYIYDKTDKEILYRVNDNRVFIEAINPNSEKPVGLGKRGEIVITSFREKGTIILRYKTGDLGELRFLNNKPLVKVYGRKPELNEIYFCGSQFSIKALKDEIIKQFKFYPKIRIVRKICSKTGQEILFISLYIHLKPNQSIKNKITNYIKDWITKEAQLGEEEIKSAKIIIQFFTQSINEPLKSWAIKQI